MKITTDTSRLFILILLGAITGCALQQRQSEPKNAYLLDIDLVTKLPKPMPISLKVRSCRTWAPLTGKSLLYRLSRVRYERDYFNLFLISPAEQIDSILKRRWLDTTPHEMMGADRMSHWVLEPTLEELWADFSDPNLPQAQVQIHFRLAELSHRDRSERVIMDSRFQAQQALPEEPQAEVVVTGLSDCVNQVLEQLETKLNDLLDAEALPNRSSEP